MAQQLRVNNRPTDNSRGAVGDYDADPNTPGDKRIESSRIPLRIRREEL